MRTLLLLVLLAPLAPAAQTFSLDLGFAATGRDETYVEFSAAGAQSVGANAYVGTRAALANSTFDVYFATPLPEDGFPSDPTGGYDYAQRIVSVSTVGGVQADLGGATVRAGIGPAISRITQTFGEDQTRLGLAAEIGVLDVYPVPSLGLGLGLHGTTTTSYTWAGIRLGARVRL